MRFILPVLALLLIALVIALSSESAPTIDSAPDLSLPAYSACTATSDCGLIALPDGKLAAVRKERLRELRHYYGRRPCTQCTAPAALRQAACRESRCVLTEGDH